METRHRRRLGEVVRQLASTAPPSAPVVRVGVIGLDSSHGVSFAHILNPPAMPPAGWPGLTGCQVTAAVRRGTAAEVFPVMGAIRTSAANMPANATKMEAAGVKIVPSIAGLLPAVDAVSLHTWDGSPRVQQAMQVLRARKPLFMDKPAGGSLADVLAIYSMAQGLGVPLFSSSALRWASGVDEARRGVHGRVIAADIHSPCPFKSESGSTALSFYGIHGVEMLFTALGRGCLSVSRTSTSDTDLCVGHWADGRIGTYRGTRGSAQPAGYGGTISTASGQYAAGGLPEGLPGGGQGNYPLLSEIVRFFTAACFQAAGSGRASRAVVAPVSAEETIEIYAFMAASDLSLQRDGAMVELAEVLAAESEKAQVILDQEWYTPGTNARGSAPCLAQVSAARAWELAGHALPVRKEIGWFGLSSEGWGNAALWWQQQQQQDQQLEQQQQEAGTDSG
jgi:predicted dehydrogenase